MSEIKSYRDLKIWRKGIDLVKETYSLCATLPDDERYGIRSQMKRAAISIPSNIAEGYGRNTTKNHAQFVRTARGSLYELETQSSFAWSSSSSNKTNMISCLKYSLKKQR